MRKLTAKQRKIVRYVEAAGRPVGMRELHRYLYPKKQGAGSVPGNVECIVRKGALCFLDTGGPKFGMAVDIPERAEDYLGDDWVAMPHRHDRPSEGVTYVYRGPRRW